MVVSALHLENVHRSKVSPLGLEPSQVARRNTRAAREAERRVVHACEVSDTAEILSPKLVCLRLYLEPERKVDVNALESTHRKLNGALLATMTSELRSENESQSPTPSHQMRFEGLFPGRTCARWLLPNVPYFRFRRHRPRVGTTQPCPGGKALDPQATRAVSRGFVIGARRN